MRGVKLEMDACGRSLVSGLPRAVTVSSEEMIEALDEPLRDLMSALHRMIEAHCRRNWRATFSTRASP